MKHGVTDVSVAGKAFVLLALGCCTSWLGGYFSNGIRSKIIPFENTANTGMVQFGVPDLKL